MKKLLIFLFLLPTLIFAQKNVVIKLPGNDPGQLKKAYYKIGQAPDSSYVTITSIDGLQIDTIAFNGGTGVLAAPQPIYGQFYSTTQQFPSAADSTNIITFDSTYLANGISLVGADRIYVSSSGTYELNYILEEYSGQNVFTWIRVNGIDIPFSTNYNRGPGLQAEQLNSHLLKLNAGDYIQILYLSSVLGSLISDSYLTEPHYPSIKAIIKKLESTGGGGNGNIPQLDITVKGVTEPYFIPAVVISNYVTPSGNATPLLSNIGSISINNFDTVIVHNLQSETNNYGQQDYIETDKINSYIEFSNLLYLPSNSQYNIKASKCYFPLLNKFYGSNFNLNVKDTLFNEFPSATYISTIQINDSFATTLYLPNLISGQFTIGNINASLKRIVAPHFSGDINDFNISANNSGVEYVQLSNTFSNLIGNNLNITFANCKLDQGSVDRILISAAAVSPVIGSGYINLSGGTSSPPSAAGLTAKAFLISNGVTVTTN